MTDLSHILIAPAPIPVGDEPSRAEEALRLREEQERSDAFLAELLARRGDKAPAVRVL